MFNQNLMSGLAVSPDSVDCKEGLAFFLVDQQSHADAQAVRQTSVVSWGFKLVDRYDRGLCPCGRGYDAVDDIDRNQYP